MSYRALAPVYEAVLGRHRALVLSRVEGSLTRHAPDARSLCDIGCGDGALLAHFASRGLEVIGVEPAPAMRRAARARLATLARAPAVVPGEMLGFELAAPVDAVTATLEVVNHLHSARQLTAFLRRARRALVPGGLVWFDASSTAWFETLWRAPPRQLTSAGIRSTWTARYDRRRRRGEMHVEVARAGRPPVADDIVMHAFDPATVERAVTRAGLAMVERIALTGRTVGPRTGRIGYVARRPSSAS